VHVLIGDVAGHGPDEAALGAALRIAFRALTFAGVDDVELMRKLERVLQSERTGTGIFATVLSLAIHPDGTGVTTVRAGHPGMLLQDGAGVDWVEPPGGPALGLRGDDWPRHELQLGAGQGLLLLTDGLFEGYSGQGSQRLGEDGLLALARKHAHLPGPAFVDALIDGAEELARPRGGLTDDIAVVRVERTTA
jgi:serine phosphatase RsbU (regulator of sigma subunit)